MKNVSIIFFKVLTSQSFEKKKKIHVFRYILSILQNTENFLLSRNFPPSGDAAVGGPNPTQPTRPTQWSRCAAISSGCAAALRGFESNVTGGWPAADPGPGGLGWRRPCSPARLGVGAGRRLRSPRVGHPQCSGRPEYRGRPRAPLSPMLDAELRR